MPGLTGVPLGADGEPISYRSQDGYGEDDQSSASDMAPPAPSELPPQQSQYITDAIRTGAEHREKQAVLITQRMTEALSIAATASRSSIVTNSPEALAVLASKIYDELRD